MIWTNDGKFTDTSGLNEFTLVLLNLLKNHKIYLHFIRFLNTEMA